MNTVILLGGLGNQLFQIATLLAHARRNKFNYVISTKNHQINLQGNRCDNYLNNIYKKINFKKEQIENINSYIFFKEIDFSFHEIPKKDNLILYGYFQSEKYFFDQKDYIKDIFSESDEIKKNLDLNYKSIDFYNTLSLHIRRGDYLKFQDNHPVCEISYYNNALEDINSSGYENIFIFSDDINWCKENIKRFNIKTKNIIFIENEYDYLDLYLMSRCKDNIIANSTFSWWGAWLNNNENKKVYCPKKWFGESLKNHDLSDLHPDDWRKI